MIWHIFKKDLRLHWKFAALMALVQFATAAIVVKLDLSPFNTTSQLRNLFQLLVMVTLTGIPFLIAAAVHQDAIPGVRLDWLVRPIQRLDLLLAKLLFVLAAVHGPMLLADLFRGLALGFPFGTSFASALSRGLFVLLALSIPMLGFLSLTKNTMEAIAAGLIVFLGFAGSMLFFNQISGGFVVGGTAVYWIPEAVISLIGLIAATAVLSLQYFRRRTLVARVLTGGGCVAAIFAMALPWNAAFAVQQRMSPNPGAASAVAVSFDPDLGRLRRYTNDQSFNGDEERTLVYLPLRFENLPANSALIVDHADVWRQDNGGVSTRLADTTSMTPLRQQTSATTAAHLSVLLPADLYRRFKDQSGQSRIELSLTLMRSAGSHTIPALNGSVRFPDLGTCSTRINPAETAVRLACVPLEDSPSCFNLLLRHIPSGASNFPQFQCQGDYTPFFNSIIVTPPPQRNLAFRDLAGLAKYPVDGTMLNESQVVMETYEPVDHFTRTVTIPSLRLGDWTPQQ